MNNVLEITEEWKTIDYKKKKYKSAKIVEYPYNEGFFRMEEVDGYIFFELMDSQMIQGLEINGQTVMVDDPLHWIGMQRLAEHSKGKVAVAGLGLGLVVHWLLQNKEVEKIDVLEINPDVIKLISETIPPRGTKLYYLQQDAFKWNYDNYDTIILDMLVTNNQDMPSLKKVMELVQFIQLRAQANSHRMTIPKIMVWGLRDPKLNPAIKPNAKYRQVMEELARAELQTE